MEWAGHTIIQLGNEYGPKAVEFSKGALQTIGDCCKEAFDWLTKTKEGRLVAGGALFVAGSAALATGLTRVAVKWKRGSAYSKTSIVTDSLLIGAGAASMVAGIAIAALTIVGHRG